jgi:protein-tyrosine phosphatase
VDKILFVCTANICRSPMAEAIFDALADDTGLPFRAESAGTAALVGRPMAPEAVAALAEAGIYREAHRARQVSGGMLEEAELVLVMSARHAVKVRQFRRDPPSGIHVLPEYATGVPGEEIADPYGHTITTYRAVLRQLYEYVGHVVDRL